MVAGGNVVAVKIPKQPLQLAQTFKAVVSVKAAYLAALQGYHAAQHPFKRV